MDGSNSRVSLPFEMARTTKSPGESLVARSLSKFPNEGTQQV
jgi:hypothetical protein